MTELDEYFIYRCKKGLKERGLSGKPEYEARLKYEMELIVAMGFPGYFMIVWDIIREARVRGIYVGPGRGSVAGALIAYCLKITNLDPLQFGLIFERFMNPERISMPDIDMDFEKERREEIIQYVIDKYGADKVAHIGTFGLLRAKNAVRSVARTLGHDYALGDHLSKMLLKPVHGKPQPLKVSFDKVEELSSYLKTKTPEGEVLKWAERVENLVSSAGVHACGVVISTDPLMETIPLFRGKSNEITTQWEMNNVEQVGLIKFDFLGLNALTKIHRCIDLIHKKDPTFDLETILLDDEATFAKLRAGEVQGVFQLEDSSGIRDLLVEMKVDQLEDIIALVAIYRPGPLDSPYKDIYLACRQGLRDPEYLVNELKPILSPTHGWMIYQEQVLQIARDLAGYTYGEADMLRRAIGKKKQDEMDKQEKRFKDGWSKSGLSDHSAEVMWKQILVFADYAFNKSHAAAYALISYQTAYLKAHYPVEFMCAVLSCESNQDSIIRYIAECSRLGIQILPPDINKSGREFQIEDNKNIRFGIAPIKNLGQAPVDMIIEERSKASFKGLLDFCDRVDLGIINRLKLESLIKAGAFDSFGYNRATMLATVESIWEYKKQYKAYESKVKTYRRKMLDYDQRLEDIKIGKLSDKGKPLKEFKRPESPNEPLIPVITNSPEMDEDELLAAEHELLGYYVTDHPLRKYATTIKLQGLNHIEHAKRLPNKVPVSIAAVITARNEITNKKKQKQAFLILEDTTGQIEATMFASVYGKYIEIVTSKSPMKFSGTVELKEVAKINQTGEETEIETESVTKLIVNKIEPLKEVQLKQSTVIELNISIANIDKVANYLQANRGKKNKVILYAIGRDGGKIRLDDIYVDIGKEVLLNALSQLNT